VKDVVLYPNSPRLRVELDSEGRVLLRNMLLNVDVDEPPCREEEATEEVETSVLDERDASAMDRMLESPVECCG
jgi:hypothetical protein